MNKKIILLLFTSLPYTLLYAQDSLKQSSDEPDIHFKILGTKGHYFYQLLKGQIILQNGDTLKGYLSINHKNISTNNAAWYFMKTANQDSTRVPFKNIKYISADIESLGNNPTIIIAMKLQWPARRYFRVIKEKGDIMICDESFGVFSDEPWIYYRSNVSRNEFNSRMFLFKKTKKILIYENLNYFFPNTNRSNEFILKFINKRYHLSLQQSDFKSGMDMLDFILNEESKN